MVRFILLFAITFTGICSLQAQSASNASGKTLTSSGGSVSNSVGNVFYKDLSGSNGTIVQGTQHAYDVTITLGLDQKFINLEIQAYPNPVTDYLSLKIDSENTNLYISELHDSKGSLLQAKKVTEKKTDIPMSNYPSGIYFLSVKAGQKTIKTFKIIKK